MKLSLMQVNKEYPQKGSAFVSAVRQVSLVVEAGEFVIITGRSGSGKTTLLNLVAGLARPTSGQVMIDDRDLWSLTDLEQSRLRNTQMGFVFQFPSLIQSLTVLENVILPGMFGSPPVGKPIEQRAKQLLEEVGLAEKLLSYPRQLSAGQQQRVVFARSLINQPGLLLADEPTSNLDEQTERELIALLKDIHSRYKPTVLLVSHDTQLVPFGTRHLQMSQGAVISDKNLNVMEPNKSE